MGFWPNREKPRINKGIFMAKSIFKIGQKPTFFGHKHNSQISAHFLPKTKLGFAHFFYKTGHKIYTIFSLFSTRFLPSSNTILSCFVLVKRSPKDVTYIITLAQSALLYWNIQRLSILIKTLYI